MERCCEKAKSLPSSGPTVISNLEQLRPNTSGHGLVQIEKFNTMAGATNNATTGISQKKKSINTENIPEEPHQDTTERFYDNYYTKIKLKVSHYTKVN